MIVTKVSESLFYCHCVRGEEFRITSNSRDAVAPNRVGIYSCPDGEEANRASWDYLGTVDGGSGPWSGFAHPFSKPTTVILEASWSQGVFGWKPFAESEIGSSSPRSWYIKLDDDLTDPDFNDLILVLFAKQWDPEIEMSLAADLPQFFVNDKRSQLLEVRQFAIVNTEPDQDFTFSDQISRIGNPHSMGFLQSGERSGWFTCTVNSSGDAKIIVNGSVSGEQIVDVGYDGYEYSY